MQLLQSWVLFEELHDGIVLWLLPREDDSDLHDQLETVIFSPFFGQDEVNVVLLAHLSDQVKQVLFLDLTRLLVFLFSELL